MSKGLRILVASSATTAATLVAVALAWSAQHALVQLQPTSSTATAAEPAWALTLLAAAAGALVATRLATCAAAVTCALLAPLVGTGGNATRRLALAASPRALRPALAAVLAGSLTMAVAAPALATSGGTATHSEGVRVTPSIAAAALGSREVASPPPAGADLPAPGWLPAPRPAAAASDERSRAALPLVTTGSSHSDGGRRRSAGPAHEVVVRRGDTLWHLAARALGPSASDAEVAAEWPRWWQANRQVIGADPHLLLPGTRLLPPQLVP